MTNPERASAGQEQLKNPMLEKMKAITFPQALSAFLATLKVEGSAYTDFTFDTFESYDAEGVLDYLKDNHTDLYQELLRMAGEKNMWWSNNDVVETTADYAKVAYSHAVIDQFDENANISLVDDMDLDPDSAKAQYAMDVKNGAMIENVSKEVAELFGDMQGMARHRFSFDRSDFFEVGLDDGGSTDLPERSEVA